MGDWKKYIPTILIFIGGIILCTFLLSLFNGKPKEDSRLELVMRLNDSLIASIKRERDGLREAKDEITKLLLQKDTVLIREYKTNTVKYEKIPVIVSNLSDDELRRSVEEFR